jgi:hypothetical protein
VRERVGLLDHQPTALQLEDLARLGERRGVAPSATMLDFIDTGPVGLAKAKVDRRKHGPALRLGHRPHQPTKEIIAASLRQQAKTS